jgi:hypothetical protein
MIRNIDSDSPESNADIVFLVKSALDPFQARVREEGYAR